MPTTSLTDSFHSFARDYSTIPLVNLPIRYIDPQFPDHLHEFTAPGGVNTGIKVYTNPQDTIQFYPDFFNVVTGTERYSNTGQLTGALSATPFIDNYRYFFDFGDGTTSSDLTASHNYKVPGTYEVTLVCVDSATNFYRSTTTATICAVNVVPDAIYLNYAHGIQFDTSSIANSALASQFKNPIFVTRYNSYQTYPAVSANGYTVRLSVSGNRSEIMKAEKYYSDSNAHLRKYAAFGQELDGQFTIVDTVSTTMTKIYGQRQRISDALPDWFLSTEPTQGSIFLGTSGFGHFYYYED